MESEELYEAVGKMKESLIDVLHIRIEAAPAVITDLVERFRDLMDNLTVKTTEITFTPKGSYYDFYAEANEALYLGGIRTRTIVEVYFSDEVGLLSGRTVYDLYAITADIKLKGEVTPAMKSLLYQIAPSAEEFDALGFRIGRK